MTEVEKQILELIQKAGDEASHIVAAREGIDPKIVAESGDYGDPVHVEMQKLLGRGGKYHHPRILTEVEVDTNGVIVHFGKKRPGGPDSIIKDIVVLKEGLTIDEISRRETIAKEVTQWVADLKTGESGAKARTLLTIERFGTNNIVFKPFENIHVAYANSLRKLPRHLTMHKAYSASKSFLKKAGKTIAVGLAILGIYEMAKDGVDAEEVIDAVKPLPVVGFEVSRDLSLEGAEQLQRVSKSGGTGQYERNMKELTKDNPELRLNP